MLFLIQYDRNRGMIVQMQTFNDSERQKADNTRLNLEIELNRQGIEREVVLLEAESIADLRRTHRRYFEDVCELTKQTL